MAALITRARIRRLLIGLAAVVAVLVVAILGLFGLLQLDWARDEIRTRIAAATADSGSEIAIDTIDGTIPFDMELRGVRVSDGGGVWLRLDRVALRWSPSALIAGRLRIDALTADQVQVLRAPRAAPEEAEQPGELSLALPQLPVDIDLRHAQIGRLDLAAPILGVPASLTATAEARLGRLGEAASATLMLRTIEGPAASATLDLSYRPEEDFLQVSGQVQEPQGGLVGRLLGLSRGRNLRIALDGTGRLSDWHGSAQAELDGRSILDLQGDVTGTAPRHIAFTLDAAPPATLLPPDISTLVASGVRAEGALRLDRAAALLHLERFRASAAAGRVEATGSIGWNDAASLAITLDADDPRPFAALLPGIAWSAAQVDAALDGSLERPRLTAKAALRDLAADAARIGTLTFDLAADAAAGLDAPVAVEAAAALSGIAPADPRLAPLVETGIRLDLTGMVTRQGTIVAQQLAVTGAGIELVVQGDADDWGTTAPTASGTVAIADIAILNEVLDLDGRGGLDLAFRIDPAQQASRIEVMGAGSDLSLGIAQLDRLLGPAPQFSLTLQAGQPFPLAIEQAEIAGAALSAKASGTIGEGAIDVKLAATIADLAALEPAMSGSMQLDGALTGTLRAPDLSLDATAPRLSFDGRVAQDLKLQAAIRNLLAPKVDLEASARVETLPARVALSAAIGDGAVDASNFTLRLGRTSLAGPLAISGGTLTGRLRLEAPELAELQSLAGIALRGSLSGDVTLSATDGRQALSLATTAMDLAVADQVSAGRATLSARLDDLLGTLSLDANAELTDATLAGQAADTLRVSATGPLTGLETELAARGGESALSAAARIAVDDGETRITLHSLNGGYRDATLRSVQEAEIRIAPGVVEIAGLALSVEDGALRLDGAMKDDALDATLRVENVPVALVKIVVPDLRLTGRVDGTLRLTGPVAAPSGTFDLAGTQLTAPALAGRQAALTLNGRLDSGQLDLTGVLDLGDRGRLDLSASASSLSGDGALRGAVTGAVDLALLDAFLAGGADRVKGKTSLDVALAGTLGAPSVTGMAALQGVEYDNLRYGLKLRQIMAQIRFGGRTVEIADLTARSPGGGRLSGQGRINLADGVQLDLALQMTKFHAIDTELASAVIDGDLALAGNVAQGLSLSGTIKVDEAEIRVPDSLPPSVQEIQVVEVNASPQRQAELDAQDQAPRQAINLDLDVAVDAPQRVFVRGRGLDAELGGALRITGTAARPEIEGALNMRRGSLDIVGKRLEFSAGKITFESGAEINPLLDFTATTRADNLTVTAQVEGAAKAPRITLSSTPTLPQDEILARLLFGKSVGALSAFELLQLAQATAELAGIGTGPGILDKVREGTGLDRLTLEQSEGAAGPSLGAGRYVSEGVYVGVTQGAKTNSGTATVEIEVTPNVKLETELGANGSGKTGVNLEWDY